jgi:hypothetical protein
MRAKDCSVGDIIYLPDKYGRVFLFIVKRVSLYPLHPDEGVEGVEITIDMDVTEIIPKSYINYAQLMSYKKANLKRLKPYSRLLIKYLFSDRAPRTKKY